MNKFDMTDMPRDFRLDQAKEILDSAESFVILAFDGRHLAGMKQITGDVPRVLGWAATIIDFFGPDGDAFAGIQQQEDMLQIAQALAISLDLSMTTYHKLQRGEIE